MTTISVTFSATAPNISTLTVYEWNTTCYSAASFSSGSSFNPTSQPQVTGSVPLVAPSVSSSLGTIDGGQTSSLTSTAVTTGFTPYKYQWFSEAPGVSSYSSIGGATSANYTFATSGSTALGTWSFELQVTDSTGATVNSKATTVCVDSALAATSITASHGTVDQGQTSVLSNSTVISSGTSPYSYQWFEKLPGGSYVKVGTSSTSFTFSTNSSTAVGSWSFILQVTDNTGTAVNSTAATVTVNVAPTVSITPASWTMDVGQSQTFTSTVTGGTGSYSYQWYLNGSAVSGATSSSWSYTPSAAGSHTVYVKVTDSASSPVTAQSNTASVTVNGALSVSISLGTVTMDVDQSKTFTSTVTGGSGSYTYQWYLNGVAVSGATSASWTFTSSSTGSYNVYVKVTDAVGAVATSTASTVTVLSVIPEFQPSMLLPLFMIITLLGAIILKRKRKARN